MTEKRFTIVNMGLDGQFIKDNGKIMLIDDVVELLNMLHEDTITLNNKLNNFKLHSKDLERENRLLKEALREELQDNGNAYDIRIFDKLFNLDYDEWDKNERYRGYTDWEEELQLKELRDLYD